MCSLLYYSVTIGARAMSCDGVRLCDIKSFYQDDVNKELYYVSINMKQSKG